jgi:hypothetical protein
MTFYISQITSCEIIKRCVSDKFVKMRTEAFPSIYHTGLRKNTKDVFESIYSVNFA